MNKLYATLFMLMAFTGFLAGQIFFKSLDISASLSTPDENARLLYENGLQKIKAKSFRGDDIDLSKVNAPVVILNFWASWCVPCLEEFPSLVELRKKYSEDQIYILGINNDMEDIKKNLKKTYKKYSLNFPSVLDQDKWTTLFKVNAIPVSIIYIDGKVYRISQGAQDFMNKDLIAKIDEAVTKK